LNIRLDSLIFDNVEGGWNAFRKIVCEAAVGILGRKVVNAVRNNSENAFVFGTEEDGFVQEVSE
jgi:hypothetical protein